MNTGFKFITLGNPQGPTLVCVPGLLGGPEDFNDIIPTLTEKFRILVANPISDAHDLGLNHLNEEIMSEVSYDNTANDIYEILMRDHKEDGYYLLGISLGGKVVYDFAIRYPHVFKGGVITDVGLSSFEHSPLYRFVEDTIEGIDLNMPWPEMKTYLRKNILEKNLRILIQTQVHYPEGKPPAKWRVGMLNFKSMLQGQAIDEQFAEFLKVDELLARENRFIHVLKGDNLSGISEASYLEMQKLKSVKFHLLEKATHFLHVTHKASIREQCLKLI